MNEGKKEIAFLHYIIGIGAVFGGLVALLQPNGPLGISTDVLEGSPFNNFLIPGLVLFGFIGLGNCFSGILAWRGSKLTGMISGFFGCGLMIWIMVQCWILGDVVFLHVLYFILGLVQGLLGARMMMRKRQFPFSLFLDKK